MGYEVDFLAVGDGESGGDAIAVRFGALQGTWLDRQLSQRVVVIDGGRTEDDGARLAEHIRRYYETETVDLALCTHPDADHSGGLIKLVKTLTVRELAMHRPWGTHHTQNILGFFRNGTVTGAGVSDKFKRALESAWQLECAAIQRGVRVVEPFTGLTRFDGRLHVLGPSREFYSSLLPRFRPAPALRTGALELLLGRGFGVPSPELRMQRGLGAGIVTGPTPSPGVRLLGLGTERSFGAPSQDTRRRWETQTVENLTDPGPSDTSAENNTSAITLLRVDNRGLLFTGDAGAEALMHAADYLETVLGLTYANLNFIQVPHHGSRRNVGPTVLNRLVGPPLPLGGRTKAAFCSCPLASDKHPSDLTTNAFLRRGAPVSVTKGVDIVHSYGAPERSDYPIATTPRPMVERVSADT